MESSKLGGVTKRFQNQLFLLALVCYALAAYFSVGYFHPDEHYQIIEFAHAMHKPNEQHHLAWEYAAKIRPAFQPYLAYLTFKLADFVGISDHFQWAFILRLLTGITAVCIIRFFVQAYLPAVRQAYQRVFIFLAYFLWFLPFLSVRFSSETGSGLMLLASLTFLIREKRSATHYLFAGLFLGIGFLFRFQLGIIIAFLTIWLLCIRKDNWNSIFILLFSICAPILMGFMIDHWFYNEWVFTPFRYFTVNLLESKAATFGISPWWSYFYYVVRYCIPPIGLLLLLFNAYLLIRHPKSIWVWLIVPFFIVHSLIQHKEERFLFPLAWLLPAVIIEVVQCIQWDKLKSKVLLTAKVLVAILCLVNAVGVFASILKPPRNGNIRIIQQIATLQKKNSIHLIIARGFNPLIDFGIVPEFYFLPDVEIAEAADTPSFLKLNLSSTRLNVVAVPKSVCRQKVFHVFCAKNHFVQIEQSVPEWLRNFIAYDYLKSQVYVLFVQKK